MLYKHQENLIKLNPPRWLLAHGTGTGKSRTSLQLAFNNCKSTLIIVPKSLKENWSREIYKCVSDNDYIENKTFTVMSKEEFKRDWELLPKYDGVIIDEMHHFAGFRNTRDISGMHKALHAYLTKHNIQYRWGNTATPYLSTPMNIFALARLLGHNWNYKKFRDTFFYEVKMGHRMVPMPKPGKEHILKKLIESIGNTVSMEELVDVPDQIFETEYFDLTDNQKNGIKSLDDVNHIVRFTKIHQIENGTLKGDNYAQDRHFDSLKIDRIVSLCEENAKVAVFCRYNLQIESLREVLEMKLKKPVLIITGQVKDRDKVVDNVDKSPQCVVLINAACSEGYELPSISFIIYASLSFSLKDYLQSQGRFLRINQLKKNYYVHLVSGEVDTGVYDAIQRKEDFHLDLFIKNK